MAPHRLLLIEDDGAVAEVLSEALVEDGYTIRHVPSPAQALVQLRVLPRFDLVLSDAFITRSGAPYAWLAQLRGCTAAPIIICSGWPAGTFGDYQARGFAGVLAKPLDLEDLLAQVATCGASSWGVTDAGAGAAVQEHDARPSGRG